MKHTKQAGEVAPRKRSDEARRFLLRREPGAAFFHLCGLTRDNAAYILDTFPVVKRKDEAKWGTYRAKDTILEIYAALAAAMQSGQPYATRLNLTPVSIQVAHAPRFDSQRISREFKTDEEQVIRRISLRPGLNILWAHPHRGGKRPRLAESGVFGHASGKTTFCRLFRHVLGEPLFGNDNLRQRIRDKFRSGWAVGEVTLEGKPWLVCP